jgi:TPR repeat protein
MGFAERLRYNWLQELAEEGHVGAISELARLLELGVRHDPRAKAGDVAFSLARNPMKSYSLAQAAARRGDPIALYITGVHSFRGIPGSLDQDYSLALKRWEEAARRGSKDAMLALSKHFKKSNPEQQYLWAQIAIRTPISPWELWKSELNGYFTHTELAKRTLDRLEHGRDSTDDAVGRALRARYKIKSEEKDDGLSKDPLLSESQIMKNQKAAALFQKRYENSIKQALTNPWDRPFENSGKRKVKTVSR